MFVCIRNKRPPFTETAAIALRVFFVFFGDNNLEVINMHTVWRGAISFGLVPIPVKLHAATEDKGIKLRQIHSKCKRHIKQEKVCPICNEDVDKHSLVRGYEGE